MPAGVQADSHVDHQSDGIRFTFRKVTIFATSSVLLPKPPAVTRVGYYFFGIHTDWFKNERRDLRLTAKTRFLASGVDLSDLLRAHQVTYWRRSEALRP